MIVIQLDVPDWFNKLENATSTAHKIITLDGQRKSAAGVCGQVAPKAWFE